MSEVDAVQRAIGTLGERDDIARWAVECPIDRLDLIDVVDRPATSNVRRLIQFWA
jgi:hypothetical protein